ncbi:MAG: DUF6115 domain-containing protein [bacterium]|nr:DUF6115 domain-containing protein [bacterium]
MEAIEIILLVAGGIIFILSFLIPEKKSTASGRTESLAREEISELVKQEMESVRNHVDDVVEESVAYAMEKTERSLERLSNEKIMAVNEYSDTVLAEIHRNHEEAMFLYDMLNSKHTNLKNTVSEVNRTVKEAEEKVTGFRKLAPEVLAQNAVKTVGKAEEAAVPSEEQSRRKEKPAERMPEPELQNGAGARQDAGAGGGNSNERILRLHRQGKSKVAIARELGLGVGEVKLVIDLFQNQRQL